MATGSKIVRRLVLRDLRYLETLEPINSSVLAAPGTLQPRALEVFKYSRSMDSASNYYLPHKGLSWYIFPQRWFCNSDSLVGRCRCFQCDTREQ